METPSWLIPNRPWEETWVDRIRNTESGIKIQPNLMHRCHRGLYSTRERRQLPLNNLELILKFKNTNVWGENGQFLLSVLARTNILHTDNANCLRGKQHKRQNIQFLCILYLRAFYNEESWVIEGFVFLAENYWALRRVNIPLKLYWGKTKQINHWYGPFGLSHSEGFFSLMSPSGETKNWTVDTLQKNSLWVECLACCVL